MVVFVLTWLAGRALARGRLRFLTAVLLGQLGPLGGRRPAPAGRPRVAPVPHGDVSDAEREAAVEAAESASAMVGPAWPLGSAVAVNPLAGLTRFPYDQALRLAGPAWQARLWEDESVQRARHASGVVTAAALRDAAADWVARQPAAWSAEPGQAADAVVRRLSAAGDDGDADGSEAPGWRRLTFAEQVDRLYGSEVTSVADDVADAWFLALLTAGLPGRDEASLYGAWRAWAAGPAVHRGIRVRGLAAAVAALPADPADAVAVLLRDLDVPPAMRRAYLGRLVARRPGWAAHVAWRTRSGAAGLPLPATGVLDVIAVRLALEV